MWMRRWKSMGCGCSSGYISSNSSGNGSQRARGFLTREEKVEVLKEYQKNLEKEVREYQKGLKSLK